MRVVIAEDQVLLREGPARLFEDGGQEIMATPGDAELLLATAVIGVGPRSWALAGGGVALRSAIPKLRMRLQTCVP